MADNKDNFDENFFERMFEIYDESGLDNFKDYEVLAMLLFYVGKPKYDIIAVSKALLKRFKCIDGVLSAPPEKLVKIIKAAGGEMPAVNYLNMWGDAFNRNDYLKPPKVFHGKAAEKFLVDLFKSQKRERLYMICLDDNGNTLNCSLISQGNFESVGFNVRKSLKTAFDYDSKCVILAHNHPSGSTNPSKGDIFSTNALAEILEVANIKLCDHIIVSDGKCRSFIKECEEERERMRKMEHSEAELQD